MKKDEMEKMLERQTYSNLWHVQLTSAMPRAPAFCLYASICPTCVSYQLRRRALYGDMSRYVCCGGSMPCSGKCKEKSCPEFCLGVEACFCYVQSVMATRGMLQDEFMIQNTKCDNCLIQLMEYVKQLSCMCSLLACITGNEDLKNLAECLRCISDIIICTVTSLMQTQHKIEMDKRDGLIDTTRAMGAPPVQQMSRNDGPVFSQPADGIPGQPVAYGYPAGPPHPHPHPHEPPYPPGPPPPGQIFAPDPPQGLPPPVLPPAQNIPLPPPVFDPEPHPHRTPDLPPPALGPSDPPGRQRMK